MNDSTYYLLKLFVDSRDNELRHLYKDMADKRNALVEAYLKDNSVHVDAGFDLFCPEALNALGRQTQKVNHRVKASMDFILKDDENNFHVSMPVGYYLYPRSSTGSKTPLRLANSVGIIDSGYRGHLIALFDNWQEGAFDIEPYQRLVQVCPPNLTYPLCVRLVDREDVLGVTMRGEGGFGSSGR